MQTAIAPRVLTFTKIIWNNIILFVISSPYLYLYTLITALVLSQGQSKNIPPNEYIENKGISDKCTEVYQLVLSIHTFILILVLIYTMANVKGIVRNSLNKLKNEIDLKDSASQKPQTNTTRTLLVKKTIHTELTALVRRRKTSRNRSNSVLILVALYVQRIIQINKHLVSVTIMTGVLIGKDPYARVHLTSVLIVDRIRLLHLKCQSLCPHISMP